MIVTAKRVGGGGSKIINSSRRHLSMAPQPHVRDRRLPAAAHVQVLLQETPLRAHRARRRLALG